MIAPDYAAGVVPIGQKRRTTYLLSSDATTRIAITFTLLFMLPPEEKNDAPART